MYYIEIKNSCSSKGSIKIVKKMWSQCARGYLQSEWLQQGHANYQDFIICLPASSLNGNDPWLILVDGWQQPPQYCKVVQFTSVVSDSLCPHGPQHARPPCPSPTARVYPNPCPLSWWCHPTISSSAVPFSSCPQSFSASGSFQISQFFASGGQIIGLASN